MTYYIIIRGPAGVGKSIIARKLASYLGGYRIAFDKIMRQRKLDRIEGKCIKESNFIKANELAIQKAGKKLAKGQIVIFDGCFYHKSQLTHLIRKLKFPHFVFSLSSNLHECITRDAKRKGKNKIGEKNIMAVYKLVSKVNYGIAIDTRGKPIEKVVREILLQLNKHHL